MKKIALVHTTECPCLGTHYKACIEFINGFIEYDYEVSCATNINECKNIDILLLSSHKIDISFLNRLNEINPNAVYILWSYHPVYNHIPFKKFILTGEYYHKQPRMDGHKKVDDFNKTIHNFVPLMLRADESPDKIGTYKRSNEINGCFMGTQYKQEWVIGLPNIIYHNIFNGLLDYSERRQIYLKSKIAFGFSANENILNYHPTQRIFEGLTYGCVVISDNEAARDLTNGIVEYASTKEEFINKYNYFLNNPNECKKKEIEGYEWAKKYGTNRYSALLFLNKIKELNY